MLQRDHMFGAGIGRKLGKEEEEEEEGGCEDRMRRNQGGGGEGGARQVHVKHPGTISSPDFLSESVVVVLGGSGTCVFIIK